MSNLNVRSLLLSGHFLGKSPVSGFVPEVKRGNNVCLHVEGLPRILLFFPLFSNVVLCYFSGCFSGENRVTLFDKLSKTSVRSEVGYRSSFQAFTCSPFFLISETY